MNKPTVHINASRKRSFTKTLFKPDEFFSFRFPVDGKLFENDEVTRHVNFKHFMLTWHLSREGRNQTRKNQRTCTDLYIDEHKNDNNMSTLQVVLECLHLLFRYFKEHFPFLSQLGFSSLNGNKTFRRRIRSVIMLAINKWHSRCSVRFCYHSYDNTPNWTPLYSPITITYFWKWLHRWKPMSPIHY